MSEVVPEDDDRGGDGAIGEALDEEDDEDGETETLKKKLD